MDQMNDRELERLMSRYEHYCELNLNLKDRRIAKVILLVMVAFVAGVITGWLL